MEGLFAQIASDPVRLAAEAVLDRADRWHADITVQDIVRNAASAGIGIFCAELAVLNKARSLGLLDTCEGARLKLVTLFALDAPRVFYWVAGEAVRYDGRTSG